MITYIASGFRHFGNDPVHLHPRSVWEFIACLSETFGLMLPGRSEADFHSRTFWCFPPGFVHGWRSDEPVDRLVFHSSVGPEKLRLLVPERGYYRIQLTIRDCERLRELMSLADGIVHAPTELSELQTESIVSELSLLALRKVNPKPLPGIDVARIKVERALAWFRDNMEENAPLRQAAQRVHLSPVHLRRMFHQIMAESPYKIFTRMRMEVVRDLLKNTDLTLEAIASQVGFSSSSALSRAVRGYFGCLPGAIRRPNSLV